METQKENIEPIMELEEETNQKLLVEEENETNKHLKNYEKIEKEKEKDFLEIKNAIENEDNKI